MEVSSINNFNKNVSFGANPLFSAKLKRFVPKMPEETVDCFVSHLKEEDLPLVEKIKNLWGERSFVDSIYSTLKSRYKGLGRDTEATPVFDRYFDNYEFFMVENPKAKTAQDRVKALMEIFFDKKAGSVEVDFLTSASNIARPDKVEEKGAGSCLLYLVSRLAQEFEKNSVHLKSSVSAEQFYEKLGFIRGKNAEGNIRYYLPCDKFDDFQKNVSKKYALKQLANLAWEF